MESHSLATSPSPIPSVATPASPIPSVATPASPIPSVATPASPIPSFAAPASPLPSLAIPASPTAPDHHHSIIVFTPADEEEGYELEREEYEDVAYDLEEEDGLVQGDDEDDEKLMPPAPAFKLSIESASRPARVSSMTAFPAMHIQPPEPEEGMDFMGPKINYLKKIAPQFNMRTTIDDDMGYPKPHPPRRGILVIEHGTTRSEVNFSTDWSPADLLHNTPGIIPGALEYNRTFYPLIPTSILPILGEGVASVFYRIHPIPENGKDFDPVRLPYRATKDLPALAFRMRVRDADEDMYPVISRRMKTKQDPVQGRSFNCIVSLGMSGTMFLDYLRAVCQKEVLETIISEDKLFRLEMGKFDNGSLVELYEAVSERGGRPIEPNNELYGKDVPDDLMMPEFYVEFVNTAYRKSRGGKKSHEKRRSATDGELDHKSKSSKKSNSKFGDYCWTITVALGFIGFIALACGGFVTSKSGQ
ncbi:hypothetical protein BC936DRAFT_138567 [Jimgerdemannia flammicorona]|uniref:Uncharacterized protein n=1 Tax=Jimgerdemannia flammicorona TaxID=994334 RepID=A0A433DIE5_9FUNG|nr:hypothetical protein BC936DRAFT_138567 [Jimgerdemannia flammicorona]